MCNNFNNSEQLALTELQEQNRIRDMGILEEELKVHGVALSEKGEEIICLIYIMIIGCITNCAITTKGKSKRDPQ
jgi:hypothetical protein